MLQPGNGIGKQSFHGKMVPKQSLGTSKYTLCTGWQCVNRI